MDEGGAAPTAAAEGQCTICLDDLDSGAPTLACGHRFHAACLAEMAGAVGTAATRRGALTACPNCRSVSRVSSTGEPADAAMPPGAPTPEESDDDEPQAEDSDDDEAAEVGRRVWALFEPDVWWGGTVITSSGVEDERMCRVIFDDAETQTFYARDLWSSPLAGGKVGARAPNAEARAAIAKALSTAAEPVCSEFRPPPNTIIAAGVTGCTSGRPNCYCKSGRTRAIVRYDPATGEDLEEYCSTADAARKLQLGGPAITDTCAGRLRNAGGHVFRYKGAPPPDAALAALTETELRRVMAVRGVGPPPSRSGAATRAPTIAYADEAPRRGERVRRPPREPSTFTEGGSDRGRAAQKPRRTRTAAAARAPEPRKPPAARRAPPPRPSSAPRSIGAPAAAAPEPRDGSSAARAPDRLRTYYDGQTGRAARDFDMAVGDRVLVGGRSGVVAALPDNKFSQWWKVRLDGEARPRSVRRGLIEIATSVGLAKAAAAAEPAPEPPRPPAMYAALCGVAPPVRRVRCGTPHARAPSRVPAAWVAAAMALAPPRPPATATPAAAAALVPRAAALAVSSWDAGLADPDADLEAGAVAPRRFGGPAAAAPVPQSRTRGSNGGAPKPVEMRRIGDAEWRWFGSRADAAKAFRLSPPDVSQLINDSQKARLRDAFEARSACAPPPAAPVESHEPPAQAAAAAQTAPLASVAVGDRFALDGRAGVVEALTATTPEGTWWQVRLDGEDEVRSARQGDLRALEPPRRCVGPPDEPPATPAPVPAVSKGPYDSMPPPPPRAPPRPALAPYNAVVPAVASWPWGAPSGPRLAKRVRQLSQSRRLSQSRAASPVGVESTGSMLGKREAEHSPKPTAKKMLFSVESMGGRKAENSRRQFRYHSSGWPGVVAAPDSRPAPVEPLKLPESVLPVRFCETPARSDVTLTMDRMLDHVARDTKRPKLAEPEDDKGPTVADLAAYLVSRGGTASQADGWSVGKNPRGDTIFTDSSSGRVFRSRPEVVRFLNVGQA